MDNDTTGFLHLEFSKIWKLQTTYEILLLMYTVFNDSNREHSHHFWPPPAHPYVLLPDEFSYARHWFYYSHYPQSYFLMDIRFISYSGCIAQVSSSVFFLNYCISLLTIMAYDQYVATCNRLQYEMIMNRRACIKMVGSVCVVSFLNSALHTIVTFTTSFCSKNINQFYCEIPHLLKIICSGLYVTEIGIVVFTAILVMVIFFLHCCYLQCVRIFSAVLRIPSIQGREKAFSTCLPHLIVIIIFLFSGWFAYLRTISDSASHLDFIITIMYSFSHPF